MQQDFSTESSNGSETQGDVNEMEYLGGHLYHTFALFEEMAARIAQRCDALDAQINAKVARKKDIAAAVSKDQQLNLGVLQQLVDDPSCTDILINGANTIYVERHGVLEKLDLAFDSEEQLVQVALDVAHACGRVVDSDQNPYVDARLPDGSRVNIVIPPVAIDGVSMSIRKFGGSKITLETIAESSGISEQMAAFLKCCGKANANMVISGGTGSGKTTMLNAVCRHISPAERVVTIEDSAELQLPIPHVVRLEAIAHPPEGGRIVTIRDLVKNALRMRPNRVIIGECRGAEAFDMIQAMNTGHDGSLSTVHANTPRDAISRIENMIGMGEVNLPTVAIRKQIASAVDFIIQIERGADGHRHTTHITEVVGIEGDTITMQDLFTYSETPQPDGSVKREHKWSEVFPRHTRLNQMLRDEGVLKLTM